MFKIYSNEEERIHIHITKAENDAKYWLEPHIELAENNGFSNKELKLIETVLNENLYEFRDKYIAYIGKRVND